MGSKLNASHSVVEYRNIYRTSHNCSSWILLLIWVGVTGWVEIRTALWRFNSCRSGNAPVRSLLYKLSLYFLVLAHRSAYSRCGSVQQRCAVTSCPGALTTSVCVRGLLVAASALLHAVSAPTGLVSALVSINRIDSLHRAAVEVNRRGILKRVANA